MKEIAFTLLPLVILSLLLNACGENEKNPCEKLRDEQMKLCEGYPENCLPCVCLRRGMDHVVTFKPPPFEMQIDIQNSGCVESKKCEGAELEEAENCLEKDDYCNPCIHAETAINMCDPTPFPDFCFDGW